MKRYYKTQRTQQYEPCYCCQKNKATLLGEIKTVQDKRAHNNARKMK